MLALDDELLKEYFAFEHNRVKDYDKTTIIKLFKYLQPFKMSVRQKEILELSDEKIKSLRETGVLKIYKFDTEDDLIKNTKLKVMLTKDRIGGSYPYPYINILDDEVDVSFTATYKGRDEKNNKNGENRDKAIEHIKALLSDANYINIYDSYLSKINIHKITKKKTDSWNINKKVLKKILPQKEISINIYCHYDWGETRKSDLLIIYSNWKIVKQKWNFDIHDRYIETDKVIILLSSGFINLASTRKDFTYIIKLK